MTEDENKASQFKQGYLYAVRLLTASKKSGEQLKKRLLDRGYGCELSEQILIQLQKQHLIDDEKLARDTALWAIEAKRFGRNRIAVELKKRGIAKKLVEDVLTSIDEVKERDTALNLGRDRWNRLKLVPLAKKQKRTYDYLVRRGFGFNLSREIIDDLRQESFENPRT